MKNYKVRLFGRGIFGEHVIPFNIEPTQEQVEDAVAILIDQGLMELKIETGFVAILIDQGLMELKIETGFHRRDRWTLTYEEVTEKKDKELILGTWV